MSEYSDWPNRETFQRVRPVGNPEKKAAASPRKAKMKTAELDRQIRILDGLLTDSLSVPPLMFRQLKVTVQPPPFDPGPLSDATREPQWEDFVPARPTGWRSRSSSAKAQYEELWLMAVDYYNAAMNQRAAAEEQRLAELNHAHTEYQREVTQAQSVWAQRNAEVDACQVALGQGDPDAVEKFVDQVLRNEWYPETFPRHYRLVYQPETYELVVAAELPPSSVIPEFREYLYVPDRDVIQAVRRPGEEISRRYRQVIASLALRTIHDIFRATPPTAVAGILFNGWASDLDPATGKHARVNLISVAAERTNFMDLELSRVVPELCLSRHLGARISPDPRGLETIEPIRATRLRHEASGR